MPLTKLIIIFASCLLFPFSASANIDFDELWSENFGGIKWGTKISELKDMKYIGKEDVKFGREVLEYKRKGDIIVIDTLKCDEISYYFWNNRFYKASLIFYERNDKIKNALFKKLWETKPDEYGFYEWDNSRINIAYAEKGISIIFITNSKISEEKHHYEKSMIKKGNLLWWAIRDFYQQYIILAFILSCLALLLIYKVFRIVNRHM